MFYENDRIVRKQKRFVNTKACEMISDLESKGLKSEEVIAALELLLEDETNTEFRTDIINRALAILNAKE